MITNLLIAVGLGISLGVADVLPMDTNTTAVVESKAQPKYVSYDDEHYTITLSADELNNYTWEYLFGGYDGDALTLKYENNVYTYTIDEDGFFYWEYTSSFYIAYASSEENTEDFAVNKFYYYNTDEFLFFDTDVEITVSSNVYEEFKHDIELDIQANTQPPMQPVLVELVSLLVGGIVQFATGIGAGVSSVVSNVMLNNGELSVFFAIVCVFAGISLAIGLSRWIMNYLTSLGAKK